LASGKFTTGSAAETTPAGNNNASEIIAKNKQTQSLTLEQAIVLFSYSGNTRRAVILA
jgi:hypothetical protein